MTASLRRLRRAALIVPHLILGVALALLCYRPNRLGPPRRQPMQWWCGRLCRLAGVRVSHQGEVAEGPVLIAANHVSWLDIMVLAGLYPCRFIAKNDVAGWPLFGWLASRVGTLYLQRGDGAVQAAEQITWRLKQRWTLVLFPEGTTTDGQTLKRFHARLFQAAMQLDTPVQPVALRYPDNDGPRGVVPFVRDDALLPHVWALLGQPVIHAKVQFLPPVQARHFSSRDALARHCQASVGTVLGLTNLPAAVTDQARYTS